MLKAEGKDPMYYNNSRRLPKPKGFSSGSGLGGKSSNGGAETSRSNANNKHVSPSSASLLYSISHQPHLAVSNFKSGASPSQFPEGALKVVHNSNGDVSPALVSQIKSELKDKIMITRERFNQLR